MFDMAADSASLPPALLQVRGLEGGYGDGSVLHGVNFDVHAGEVVTLLGRNGAGKSTIMRALMGILAHSKGSVMFGGVEMIGLPSRKIACLGIGYVPEERGIFSSLSTEENLLLPPQVKRGGLTVEQIYELFPNLEERKKSRGTKLSGGEQQMLALGRILRTGAKLLLLDEPTEGLAPVIVQQIGKTIEWLKQDGFTILLVEQNFRFAQTVADRHYIVHEGSIVEMLVNDEIEDNLAKLHSYLGV
ncbi:ABC transporter ATP-binding protein [Mesorhizobium sp. B292B1B]|uniref:ABC transporter ATP-binding protein n=1 Tax=unclassified Mesorhizobium TaxID=325217 RepID=UPI00112E57CF|nr:MULTISPECIES: ABC transporter ATP-binding protein [unclassified Mesorhizobium]MCA0010714.1 ABC transporter ATP-binding protein [Mesorhizobium sp. B294B1A1]MCA0036092.1 ABC transporter ATP-binding protein [Mesorhizobium sp. B292B1B]TPM49182.1 ABC transporter ATP-binding protein [Mesorhizobium sp. B2-3-2]